jgi:hypothetical protein
MRVLYPISASVPTRRERQLMMAVFTASPAAVFESGPTLAVSIALGVTAIVALVMVISQVRRTPRLTPLTGGLGAASAVALLTAAVVVGLAVSTVQPEPAAASVPLEVTQVALQDYQLETLPLP